MKKFISLSFMLICFKFNTLKAQGVELGAKFGTDIQKITGATFSDKFSFGYHLGGFAILKLTSSFGIQPELYYSSVNSDTATGFSAVYGNVNSEKIHFSYLNVPILVNFRFNNRLTIQLGPKFSMLTDKNSSAFSNSKNALKTGDVSGVVGAQFNLLRFKIYGRYQFGLNDLNNLSDAANALASKEVWKNQSIHIGVGMRLL